MAQTLELTATNNDVNIVEHMVIVADRNFDLNDAAARRQAEQKAINISIPNQIMPETTADGDWGYLRIDNTTNKPISRVLDTEHFTNKGYAIYLEQSGEIELILDARLPAQQIEDRIRPELILASDPVPFAAKEEIRLWVQFQDGKSAGTTPIYLREEAELNAHRVKNAMVNIAFYGVGLTLLVFLLLLALLLDSQPARFYLVFLFASIALNFQQDGYFSQFFYAGEPNFHALTRFLWQVLMVISYQLFIVSFLDIKRRHPHLLILPRTFIGLVVATAAVYPFLYGTEIYQLLFNIVAWTFVAISVGAAILAFKSRIEGSGFFILGVAIFISYLSYSIANKFLSEVSYAFEVVRNVKALQLLDASVFAAAMLRQTFALRDQRDDALKSELAAAQESLTATRAQLEAEKDRDRAKVLAEKHRERLAMTSHDLRQPLTSLQLALEQADSSSPELKKKLTTGLDYLNSVLGTTLKDTRHDGHGSEAFETESDPVPIQTVFDNLKRMFGAEAKKKGLSLSFEPTDLAVATDAVGLIRMLSNLISNAIKYTKRGQITVRCFKHGDHACVEVRDSGDGLSEEQLSRVMQPYQRNSSDEDGEGLGLHIVSTMAKRASITFEADSDVGRGTVFQLGGFSVCP